VALSPLLAGAETGPPKILFLLTDDQHADTLWATGNPLVITPEVDKLAGEGTPSL